MRKARAQPRKKGYRKGTKLCRRRAHTVPARDNNRERAAATRIRVPQRPHPSSAIIWSLCQYMTSPALMVMPSGAPTSVCAAIACAAAGE